jgi:transmembrane sensor
MKVFSILREVFTRASSSGMTVQRDAGKRVCAALRGYSEPMTSDDELIPDAILDQATAWIVRLQESPNDKAARAEFKGWLAQSDVHARAWAKSKRAWGRMGQVPSAFAHEWPRRTSHGGSAAVCPGFRPRRLGVRYAVIGLAACLFVALLLPSAQVWLIADYATAVAETSQISLEDGSTVHLGADSAMAVEFGAARRQVTLLRGEAYFDVVSDRERPFSVHADDLDVTVTGTAFDVGITDRSFSVTVGSGSVRVSRPGLKESGAVVLAPGQGLWIDRATGEASDTTTAGRTIAAWRSGHLIVENAPLTDVVAAIARYRRGVVVVADDALREKRVTGGYDLHDPERALRLLVAPYGGTVRQYTPWILVLSGD